ncbi:hypothetical protein DL98DRAFT_9148 [Cadophora sp. DSE1049]|nr:hypothetical protein DL98DRAFT_9148 [Cadophora sp. DSE1049]
MDYVPYYNIVDTEAREARELVETPGYSLEGLVELGPKNTKFMGVADKKLPNELKAMVLMEKFLREPRNIRALFDSNDDQWTYRCSNPPNKIPFVIYGLNKLIEPHVRSVFKKGPWLGMDAYPFFNPAVDTLSFEYLDCDSSPEGSQNYQNAMSSLIGYLQDHADTPGSPPIAGIQITWCHNEGNPKYILNQLRSITTLKKVTLLAHDHFTDAFEHDDWENQSWNNDRENDYEPTDMRSMVKMGELEGSTDVEIGRDVYEPYPFEVVLVDQNGDVVDGEDSDDEDEDWFSGGALPEEEDDGDAVEG